MSTNEKMEVLDDKFLEAESVKNQITQECQQLEGTFQQIMNSIKASRGTDIEPVLEKLRSFLSSGISTMQNIQKDIKDVTGTCAEIQKTFQQMGA